jgi:hypothetical protein
MVKLRPFLTLRLGALSPRVSDGRVTRPPPSSHVGNGIGWLGKKDEEARAFDKWELHGWTLLYCA